MQKTCKTTGCYEPAARNVSSTHPEDRDACVACRRLSAGRRWRADPSVSTPPPVPCTVQGCVRLSARVQRNTRPDQASWCRRCRKQWRIDQQDLYRKRFVELRSMAAMAEKRTAEQREQLYREIMKVLEC